MKPNIRKSQQTIITRTHEKGKSKIYELPLNEKQKGAQNVWSTLNMILKRKLLKVLEQIKNYNFNMTRKTFIQENFQRGYRVKSQGKKKLRPRARTLDPYAEYSRARLLKDIIEKLKAKRSSDLSSQTESLNIEQRIHYMERIFQEQNSHHSHQSDYSNNILLQELMSEVIKLKREVQKKQESQLVIGEEESLSNISRQSQIENFQSPNPENQEIQGKKSAIIPSSIGYKREKASQTIPHELPQKHIRPTSQQTPKQENRYGVSFPYSSLQPQNHAPVFTKVQHKYSSPIESEHSPPINTYPSSQPTSHRFAVGRPLQERKERQEPLYGQPIYNIHQNPVNVHQNPVAINHHTIMNIPAPNYQPDNANRQPITRQTRVDSTEQKPQLLQMPKTPPEAPTSPTHKPPQQKEPNTRVSKFYSPEPPTNFKDRKPFTLYDEKSPLASDRSKSTKLHIFSKDKQKISSNPKMDRYCCECRRSCDCGQVRQPF